MSPNVAARPWRALFAFVFVASGCGAAQHPQVAEGAPPASPGPSAPVDSRPPSRPDGVPRIARSAVHDVIAKGLGAFLQHVELDGQPVRDGRAFRGFRIVALRGNDGFWAGVDLRPGDVVTRVNGFPIERPEQAQTAFESLDVASELRVAYDREGEPREIVYRITDDP